MKKTLENGENTGKVDEKILENAKNTGKVYEKILEKCKKTGKVREIRQSKKVGPMHDAFNQVSFIQDEKRTLVS